MEKITACIDSERVVLKTISYNDTSLIIKWRNNPLVKRNFIFRENFTNSLHHQWMEDKINQGTAIQFIIYAKNFPLGSCKLCYVPIGSVYLRDIDRVNNAAEFGIFIGDDTARGLGYGREATRLLCRYSARVLRLTKLTLRVFADNVIARRTYEKVGFVAVEILKRVQCSDGESKDMILMEKLL